jgi:hypothetical protein
VNAILGFVAAAGGFAVGYALCYLGTWLRVHRQESNIRALITDIKVLMDMDDEVPTPWVLNQLEAMLVKEFG